MGPDLVEHCLPQSSGHEDSIYRDVEVVRHPGAELGESNQYNIDLAPKVACFPPPLFPFRHHTHPSLLFKFTGMSGHNR